MLRATRFEYLPPETCDVKFNGKPQRTLSLRADVTYDCICYPGEIDICTAPGNDLEAEEAYL